MSADHELWCRAIEAERDRYKAALEEIASASFRCGECGDADYELANIARAALAGDK